MVSGGVPTRVSPIGSASRLLSQPLSTGTIRTMTERAARPFGKYVPISSRGQVRLYIPLEQCADVGQLQASGYDINDESLGLIRTVQIIKEAESRRAESDQRKRMFVTESLADFSREAGTIDVICPYCLGTINRNWPHHEGEVLCGWYDHVTNRCDGNASYTIDRANLVLGKPDVERYACPAKGTQLDLAVYDFDYLKEELDRRTRAIRRLGTGAKAPVYDAELAKLLPLRIGLDRTRPPFKELVLDLMGKDAITWLNTLCLEELTSLLQRSVASDMPTPPGLG